MLTIFPKLVDTFCEESLLGRARATDKLDLRCHDLREFTTDVHRTTDDTPFGGGAGMVLKAEPIKRAIEETSCPRPILALGPGGRKLTQDLAVELGRTEGFTLLCGRYEGIDHRVREHLCDGEISIGDVVLAGGEVAACVVIEAVTRLLPGVMGNQESAGDESFGANGLLEYPQFTRPFDLDGWSVPDVLRSGDHAENCPLATGAGAASHSPGPPRPDRCSGRHHGQGTARLGRIRSCRLSFLVPVDRLVARPPASPQRFRSHSL